jgi:hypothetical protein
MSASKERPPTGPAEDPPTLDQLIEAGQKLSRAVDLVLTDLDRDSETKLRPATRFVLVLARERWFVALKDALRR